MPPFSEAVNTSVACGKGRFNRGSFRWRLRFDDYISRSKISSLVKGSL
jgi:hypothetical protein